MYQIYIFTTSPRRLKVTDKGVNQLASSVKLLGRVGNRDYNVRT